ncbi:MAG: type II secretion system F family protein [Pseudomonadota bacterium]
MPTYAYQAKAFNGKIMQGTVEASSEAEARIKLRAKKLIPIKVSTGAIGRSSEKRGGQTKRARVKPKDLQVFTRQLSVLISSGVPLVQALEVLSQSPRGRGLDLALAQIVTDISEGKKMGTAFRAHPHVFSKFYINMLIAGEEGGVLDQVLDRLSQYIEKSVKLQGKIKGAMSYPIVVLFIALGVVLGLLVGVIPKFVEIFKSSGQKIPPMTQLCIDMSNFVTTKWYLLVAAAFGIFMVFRTWSNSEMGRRQLDQILIRVPIFGEFIVKANMAKFSRTLSTLLGAGVSIMEALQIAANTAGNSLIEAALLKSKASVAKGKLLSVPLAQEPFIPHMVTQMIAVGEQTGALDSMLDKVADFYEDEVDVAVGSITSLMEPVMIVVLGGIVAFFVIAMYLPIFNMAGGV